MGNDDFIITPKEDKTITMTIRIERIMQEQLDELARRSNRSRNEIVNMALEYALKNAKFTDSTDSNKDEKPSGEP
ncbi:ribbon-helix-helix protein, CopG family [Paenibacillaceae bacterium WGS1546]|uniref:ribbon-helix-helix protein, CopG family n=1 Tax=Cohnella sp. WGS1546 TaxID=3366810 RepID=UPI00372D0F1C